MKTLKQLATLSDSIDPELEVIGIWDIDSVIFFDTPRKAKLIECNYCNGRIGFKLSLGQNQNVWSCLDPKCLKFKRKRRQERISNVGQYHMRFEDFDVPHTHLNANLNDCSLKRGEIEELKRFALKPDKFVLFGGSTGTGKTWTAVSVARYFFDNGGKSCRFVNANDLFDTWLASETKESLKNKYICPVLLILDDIGIRAPSEAFLGFLYSIINARMNTPNCGTIITTNLNGEKLLSSLGEAIYDRIDSGLAFKFEGKSKRKHRI